MYFHLAMLQRVESTSGRGGYGLLYLPTSAKAVTNLTLPAFFLTRKEVFKYSAVTPNSFGLNPLSLKVTELLLEFV